MAYPQSCCDITAHIAASTDCAAPQGGAKNLLIACLKHVTFSEVGCAGADITVDSIGLTVAPNDAHVYALSTGGTPYFYNVDTKDKTLEHVWSIVYDPDTNQKTYTETVNFDIEVKDRNFYCVIESYIGQEVVLLFQEKGTDRWYMVGRDGGISVNEMTGGTGTTDFTPTSFVVGGEGTDTIFRQLILRTEDPDNAGTLIDDTTAQVAALTAA